MTLLEQLCLVVVIAIVESSLLVARLWCFESGLVLGLLPFALVGTVVAIAAGKERRALRDRIPKARLLTRRAS
jgi:uncharacterized integral membrane protein